MDADLTGAAEDSSDLISDTDSPAGRFERSRASLFAAHGFAGQSKRIPDHSGRRTYAMVRGDGPCPTVLIHGGIGVATEWALLAGRLTGPVVIVDRPGYGLTYPMDYRGIDFRRDAADWLLGVVDGLGAERINLVGGSMGGFFAMAFATAHPDRVRLLGLVGAPAGLHRGFPLFLRMYAHPILGRIIARINMSPKMLRDRAFATYLTHPEKLTMDLLEVAASGGMLPGTALTARTVLSSMATLRGQRPELLLWDDMTRLEVPTRLIWGDHDSILPFTSGEELAGLMPDAQLTVIADAGHMPQLDQPAAVAAVLDPLLGSSPLVGSALASGRTPLRETRDA